MTIEKAIETLEDLRILDGSVLSEALQMAISALRAKQEAEKFSPPCYQPEQFGDGCAYQCYDGDDDPLDKCKECPLCNSDKHRSQQEAEKNEPRKMISKPVWCEDESCWASLRNLAILAEQNVPLTREELQKMHGKRVLVELYPDPGEEQSSFWAQVSVDPNDGEIFLRNDWGGASAYEEVSSDIRAIYRHPPKEAPNV